MEYHNEISSVKEYQSLTTFISTAVVMADVDFFVQYECSCAFCTVYILLVTYAIVKKLG